MLNGVIFDFNGTLFFDTQYHVQVFDALSVELTGKHLSKEEFETLYAGKPNVEIFRLMTDGKLTNEEYHALSKRKEEMYRETVRNVPGGAKLCDGAEEMFALLTKYHVPFTIASASIYENISFFFETFHLGRWFDIHQVVYDDGSYRDKEMMFVEAAKRIGAKGHIIVFEDSLSGMKCAAQMHAELIMIESESLRNAYADYPVLETVHTLKEALPLIERRLNE